MIKRHVKKTVLIVSGLCLAGMAGHAETVLAGWSRAEYTKNKNGGKADIVAADIAAKVMWSDGGSPGTHWSAVQEQGSADGTFGANIPGASTAGGAYMTGVEGAYLDFTVTNKGQEPVELKSFCFDAWRAAPDSYQLSAISGDLVTEVAAGKFTATKTGPPANADFEDFDISLANLAERSLTPGQSITFRLKTVKKAGGGNLFIDSIAVCGN
jgi:hypothetical protein